MNAAFPSRLPLRALLVGMSCACLSLPCLAESLTTSASSAGASASSAGSVSLRGSSDSIKSSSNSSSGKDENKVADGDYRVTEVAALADQPQMLRLTLRPAVGDAQAAAFTLDLPRRALGERPLAAGDVVSARNRPYGLEFARAQGAAEPFFLVVADDWERDLQTRVLTN